MSTPKILQVRTKLGGFVTPDQRDLLTDYNSHAPYATKFSVEYNDDGFWMHGTKESVLVPRDQVSCIVFERPAPEEAKKK